MRTQIDLPLQALTNTILEQTFEIEFLVQYGQCPSCAQLAAKNTWKAMVQVRQKVSHKRTFLYLEQLILKHYAQKDTISVREVRDGLDFFYSQRNHAIKIVEFLTSVVPVRYASISNLHLPSLSPDPTAPNHPNNFSQQILIPTPPTTNSPTPSKSLQSAKTISSAYPSNLLALSETSIL